MQTIRVNGVELPYRDEGVGRPIVLVHGGGPDMDTLVNVSADLVRDHRVITYNRRGYWQAGPPATSWAEHRDDLVDLIGQLGLRDVVLVAFSAGAIVALDVALHQPQLVGALVLHDPAIYGKRHVTPGLAWQFIALQWRRRLLPEERAMTPFLRWVMRHRDGTSVWDRNDYTDERRQLSLRNAQAVRADIDNGDGSHIPQDQLGDLRCPVTLVMGAESQRWFHKIARTLTDALPSASVVHVPGVGHAMVFEDPTATAEAIRAAVQATPEVLGPTS